MAVAPFLANKLQSTYSNRGFSCDVISSQFCKSSYSGLPCWFPCPISLALENTTKCPATFHIVHFIIPNYNWVTRILVHTSQVKFKILLWSEPKIIACFAVFLHTALCKRKPRSGAKSCVYKCVPRRANPLFLPKEALTIYLGWQQWQQSSCMWNVSLYSQVLMWHSKGGCTTQIRKQQH